MVYETRPLSFNIASGWGYVGGTTYMSAGAMVASWVGVWAERMADGMAASKVASLGVSKARQQVKNNIATIRWQASDLRVQSAYGIAELELERHVISYLRDAG
jgi:hypothetical protein